MLNASCQCLFPTIPCEPRFEIVKVPGPASAEASAGKHTVLYNVNSMIALEVADASDAERLIASWPPASKPQFSFTGQTECRALVLNVTHACNLACAYCFVRNYSSDQGGLMTMDTARKAIALIPEKAHLDISFFGGEPLIAWPLIGEIVAYVEDLALKRGVGKHFHVTTNALLLDADKVRFMDAHGFSMIVSLDGPEDLHNQLRPAKDAKVNSHSATLAAVRLLKGTGLAMRTTLRSTFTGMGVTRVEGADRLNPPAVMEGPRLVERLAYLNALVADGCAGHVSAEPCSLNESACLRLPDGHPLSITPAHYDALTREYQAAAEWYVREVRAGKRPTFHHFLMPLRRLLYTQHAPSECGAGCGYLSVDPDGNLYGCHREGQSLIGRLDSGVDEELRAKWKDNRFYTRPDCTACAIKHVCGGGCRLDSLERNGDIHVPDAAGCFFKRRIFEAALWILCELGPDRLKALIPNPREIRRPAPSRPPPQR